MLKKFILMLTVIFLAGCEFLNAENQEELYKRTFQERRRPIYNPGGLRFSSQKDFYNAYMKKHRGVIGPISGRVSSQQFNTTGRQGGPALAGDDGRPDGMRLIDSMSIERRLMPRNKALSPQAKLPVLEKGRPIPINKDYAGKSAPSFSYQAQQKQIARSYIDVRGDIANVGKDSAIEYDIEGGFDGVASSGGGHKSGGQYVEKFAERNAPSSNKSSAKSSGKPMLPTDTKNNGGGNSEQKGPIPIRERKPQQETVVQHLGSEGDNNDDIENIVKKLYE